MKNDIQYRHIDDTLENLANSGGYEYLGKDEEGMDKFGDEPIEAIHMKVVFQTLP